MICIFDVGMNAVQPNESLNSNPNFPDIMPIIVHNMPNSGG